jgi:hypothetical protein
VEEFLQIVSQKLETNTSYSYISPDEFRQQGFPGAKQIAEMYQWYLDGGHSRSVENVRSLFPFIQSMSEWMEAKGAQMIKNTMIQ